MLNNRIYSELIPNHAIKNCNCFHCINKYEHKYEFTINGINRGCKNNKENSINIDNKIIKLMNMKNNTNAFIDNINCVTFDLDYSKLKNVKYLGIIYNQIPLVKILKLPNFANTFNNKCNNIKYLTNSVELLFILNDLNELNVCLTYLPHKLKHLHLYDYIKRLDKLPISLQYLNTSVTFYHKVENLPPFLKELQIGWTNYYYNNIDNLPDSIEFLSVATSHRINKLPKSLIHLVLYLGDNCSGHVLKNVKNIIVQSMKF